MNQPNRKTAHFVESYGKKVEMHNSFAIVKGQFWRIHSHIPESPNDRNSSEKCPRIKKREQNAENPH